MDEVDDKSSAEKEESKNLKLKPKKKNKKQSLRLCPGSDLLAPVPKVEPEGDASVVCNIQADNVERANERLTWRVTALTPKIDKLAEQRVAKDQRISELEKPVAK